MLIKMFLICQSVTLALWSSLNGTQQHYSLLHTQSYTHRDISNYLLLTQIKLPSISEYVLDGLLAAFKKIIYSNDKALDVCACVLLDLPVFTDDVLFQVRNSLWCWDVLPFR